MEYLPEIVTTSKDYPDISKSLDEPNFLESIPYELVLQIASELPLSDIIKLCSTNRYFNETICNKQSFWKMLVLRDFSEPDYDVVEWKDYYISMHDVWVIEPYITAESETVPRKIGDILGSKIVMPDEDSSSRIAVLGIYNDLYLRDDAPWDYIETRRDIPYESYYKNYPGAINWIQPYERAFAMMHDGNYPDDAIYIKEIDEAKRRLRKLDNLKVKDVYVDDRLRNSSEGVHLLLLDLENNVILWKWLLTDNQPFKKISNLKVKSMSIGDHYMGVIDINDNLWISSRAGNNYFEVLVPINVKAKSVSCGVSSVIFIDIEDNLIGMGLNSYGELGLGHNDQVSEFSKIPIPKVKYATMEKANHTLAIDINNHLWLFGNNSYGQLGIYYQPGVMYIPIPIEMKPEIKKGAVSKNRSVILDSNNDIWIAGENIYDFHGYIDPIDDHTSFYKVKGCKAKDVFVSTRSVGFIGIYNRD